jgi:hypothetical protein
MPKKSATEVTLDIDLQRDQGTKRRTKTTKS